ncbi:MAG: rod shape-determining protein MreD, partial [Stenotrophobium sp.]
LSARTLNISFLLSLAAALLLQLVELPELLAAARPMWLPLVVAYWSLTEPRASTLLGAFVFGVFSDVLFGSVLGEHALGLVLVAYVVARLRPIFILFPLWQATLALIPAWLVFAFLMFWIDGITRHNGDQWLRWMPVLSTTLFWPLVYAVMELLRTGGTPDEE